MLDRTVEYVPLRMLAPRLIAPGPADLPRGFGLRLYRPGDEGHWARIETSAGEFTREWKAYPAFERHFGAGREELRERMIFLTDRWGLPVGTAAAWREEERGRLHWVAIDEKHQGLGLARPLIRAAVRRLAELGHREAYLTTQTSSWVAIRLYGELGFRPVVENERDEHGWEIVRKKLEERK